MARFSASVVRSACSTCRSWLLATKHAYRARESRRAAVKAVVAARIPTRRVKPNATSWALRRSTAPSAMAWKYAVSARVGARPTTLDEVHPSSSNRLVIASLSDTDRLRPSCWDPSRSVVSNTWNSAGLGSERGKHQRSLQNGLASWHEKTSGPEDRRFSAPKRTSVR
jgi:hypothetical protein